MSQRYLPRVDRRQREVGIRDGSTSIAMLPMGFSMTSFFFLPRETEKKSAVVFNILLFNLAVGTLALLVLVFFPQMLANLLVSDQVAVQAPEISCLLYTSPSPRDS